MDRNLSIRKAPAKKNNSLSKVSKIFFGLNIFQVIEVVVMQASMIGLGDFSSYDKKDEDDKPGMGPGRRVYMGLFMGSVVYTCFLCLFAVKRQNFFEILAFVLQNWSFVIYSGIQVYHVGFKKFNGRSQNRKPVLVALAFTNMMSLTILGIAFTYLAFKLYKEFGWKIYKRVRFDMKLRKMYQTNNQVSCFIKMGILFWWMFALCNALVILNSLKDWFYYLQIALIITATLTYTVGIYATWKEKKVLMICFLIGIAIGIGYFVYQIYRFFTRTCHGCPEVIAHGEDIPDEAFLHLIYLGSVNLLFLVLILITGSRAVSHFGKGLTEHTKHYTKSSEREISNRTTSQLVLSRMSLDIELSVASVTSLDDSMTAMYGLDNSASFTVKDFLRAFNQQRLESSTGTPTLFLSPNYSPTSCRTQGRAQAQMNGSAAGALDLIEESDSDLSCSSSRNASRLNSRHNSFNNKCDLHSNAPAVQTEECTSKRIHKDEFLRVQQSRTPLSRSAAYDQSKDSGDNCSAVSVSIMRTPGFDCENQTNSTPTISPSPSVNDIGSDSPVQLNQDNGLERNSSRSAAYSKECKVALTERTSQPLNYSRKIPVFRLPSLQSDTSGISLD